MKVLVTGGCGFIGSHLVDKLVIMNHDVTVLDNLTSGKKENMNPNARLVVGDVRDVDNVKSAMKGCEAVFHLAALTDVRADDIDADYQVNYLGSKNVFSVAEALNAKVIFTSSAAVYGNEPAKEEGKCSPLSQYGKSKLKSEKACHESAFIVRIFNTYGPRGKSVVNKFCKKVPRYEDITVFGNGLQTRDYVHVTDVVNAILLGLKKSGTCNVGTGVETSILNLIDIIFKTTNNKPRARFTAPKENEIKRSKADITKIRQLGWEPRIGIEEGVRLTLEAEQ